MCRDHTRSCRQPPERTVASEARVVRQGAIADHAHAIELLDGLLSRPAEITVEVLKLEPIWDPMRKDPAFQALIEKYSAKT